MARELVRDVYMHTILGLVPALAGCGASPAMSPATSTPAAVVATTAAPFSVAAALAVESHDVELTDVRFRDGGELPRVRIHVSTAGTAHRDATGAITNAVLLLHWTGSSSEVLQSRAFMDALYAPGRPLDLADHYLVFVDAIGHGRSSKPSDGLHARFPAYGYEDMVALQHRAVTEGLGLTHLHAIIGLSMGGMNAWLWAERHPDFMDAIIPIVALPAPISGRNLVWRRFVSHQIRSDPSWEGGNYHAPPRGWVEAFPVFRMMLDGVPHLHAIVPDRDAADTFVRDASAQAERMDANDVLYALEASGDYDPRPDLSSIRARVFALNFGDDEFNPTELGVLEEAMSHVPNGTFVVQPGSASSFGHFTQAHPELWSEALADFLRALEGQS